VAKYGIIRNAILACGFDSIVNKTTKQLTMLNFFLQPERPSEIPYKQARNLLPFLCTISTVT